MVEPTLDNVFEEMASLVADGIKLTPALKGYGLKDLSSFPSQDLVVSGTAEAPTEFLSDLIGGGNWEAAIYVEPLLQIYEEKGVTNPKEAFRASQQEMDDFEYEVRDAFPSCRFTVTFQVHTMNYLFKGDLKKGITWQGWE
jgi:hypothetical protein